MTWGLCLSTDRGTRLVVRGGAHARIFMDLNGGLEWHFRKIEGADCDRCSACVVHFCVAGFLAAAVAHRRSVFTCTSCCFTFLCLLIWKIPFWGGNYPLLEGIVSGSHYSVNVIVNHICMRYQFIRQVKSISLNLQMGAKRGKFCMDSKSKRKRRQI